MKKLLLLTLCAMFSCIVLAVPVSRQQARQRAALFLQDRTGSHDLSPVTTRAKLAPRRIVGKAETEAYYVFNRGEGEGFIIVGADSEVPEVLGYCDTGSFDFAQLPVNMQSWLNSYEQQINDIQAGKAQRAPVTAATHDAVKQLMTCTWNQGYPYNQKCPGGSVTGCVATAMAQLLYYQREKSVTETQADIPGYTTYTDKRKVPGIAEGAPIDWHNMKDRYSGNETSTQRNAVANLMLYCGTSVEMDYTTSASGAQSYRVADAMKAYFGYGASVQYVQQSNYTNTQWDNLLYNELANDRPFYISGANSEAGHAFVCDGYDGKGYYHINWGWGGSSDGYYLLTNLTPGSQGIGGSSDGYNSYVDAIIGIEPENFDTKPITFGDANVRKLCIGAFDADSDGNVTYSEAAAVTDLGTIFSGLRTIRSFAELKFFTSLTAIPDDAFSGCMMLNTLRLPKSITTIGARAFAGCTKLTALQLPEGLTAIGDSAFAGCKTLDFGDLPAGITTINSHTFQNCLALKKVLLPKGVTSIGTGAFAGCTKLTDFTLAVNDPNAITLGTGIFEGIDLSAATLTVPEGSKVRFADTDQWKDFGRIYEVRVVPEEVFKPLTEERVVYLKNVGIGLYLTKGEAWGTQAIVGSEPMRFKVRRDDKMPEGQYYLYSDDTGSSRHRLFRTSSDDKVGSGVQATFVDGYDDSECAWNVVLVEGTEDTYTFQIPKGKTGFVASRFWGVQTNHKSKAASPTYGVYSDIIYANYQENCQWRFVDYEGTYATYNAALELENLLRIAKTKKVDVTREQAIFDDLTSDLSQLRSAMVTLRRKLGLIHFADDEVKNRCLVSWDLDGDGELSFVEASKIDELGYAFYGSNIPSFDELQYFTGLTTLYGNSFEGNASLKSIKLPESLTTMYYRIFYGCSALTEITLPRALSYLGSNAFQGCTSLRTVRVAVPNPSRIELADDIFEGVDLSAATLVVPHGSRELYAKAPVWMDFGTIIEMRAAAQAPFSEATADTPVYVYNIGADAYINKGEAWGTQAVTAQSGIQFQLKRTAKMPEGQYYLQSSNGILFRTDSDSKVGTGVKTCFVDGSSVTTKAYWQLVDNGDFRYTLQVPENDADYEEELFLGTDPYHESKISEPTAGLYYDVERDDQDQRCLWAFIRVSDVDEAEAFDADVALLSKLLGIADAKEVEATEEHAVYDDFDATRQAIRQAIASLRQKLGLIAFADQRTRTLSINAFDLDDDEELSLEEAAAITDLGTTYRGVPAMHSFDELQYFTSLTEIPSNSFANCTGLISVYLPANVTNIAEKAFQNCAGLRYIASANTMVTTSAASGINKDVTLFAPAALLDSYRADSFWSTQRIEELTGQPTVTALDASRQYGRSNPTFEFIVTGAPINGTPSLLCETDQKTPAGSYPITVGEGTVTNEGLVTIPATLTIERAPLTVTARSCKRYVGQANPEFEFSYRSFRNGEKAADAFTVLPTAVCDATEESPAGDYEIRVIEGEALNYEVTYVNGTLTVEPDPSAIAGIQAESNVKEPLYDLAGRRQPPSGKLQKGVYVRHGQKVVK